MKKILYTTLIALCACAGEDTGDKFTVNGKIDGVMNDTTLLFEAVRINGDTILDSIRLTTNKNTFCFKDLRPTSPEFFRLRIGSEFINICIDSTENITINASLGKMSTGYEIDGSEKCEQMRQLAIMQTALQRDVRGVMERNGMSPQQRYDAIDAMVEAYKDTLIRSFIAPDPASAVAYYALFQNIGGSMIFNAHNNRRDIKWMAAVATAWDLLYPESQRTQNLHNVALRGMALTSKTVNEIPEIKIDESKIEEVGVLDIVLPDVNGNEHSLRSLKGKVVLLDFTSYNVPGNRERITNLLTLYNKYKSQGFEIYQVSVDTDRHFWSVNAEQLPWLCVYNQEGMYSDILHLYNVQALPTIFLIDRENNLITRSERITDIDEEIKKLL